MVIYLQRKEARVVPHFAVKRGAKLNYIKLITKKDTRFAADHSTQNSTIQVPTTLPTM